LGLLNFYRHFLQAVARTLFPLMDALKGNRKGVDVLERSADMEAAFTSSKKALASVKYLLTVVGIKAMKLSNYF
jgi:hypothetical protein